LNRIWLEANRRMFGKSVTLTDDYGWWWMYIGHFIHSPFYCYAYAFGELLVLSLYSAYLKDPSSFRSKYLRLLSSGGSQKPQDLLSGFGFDLSQRKFWEEGASVLEALVNEAGSLSARSA